MADKNQKVLYAGVDESGCLRPDSHFVLACALSHDRTDVQPGDRKAKVRHKIELDEMPDFRFMLIGSDMLQRARKIDSEMYGRRGSFPSSERRLRSYSIAYLLKAVVRSSDSATYSVFVDSYCNPDSLRDELAFLMKGMKGRCSIKCENDADRNIPLVNDADAIAYYLFRFVWGDRMPPDEAASVLDDLFCNRHVNIYTDHFLDGYRTSTLEMIRLGTDYKSFGH